MQFSLNWIRSLSDVNIKMQGHCLIRWKKWWRWEISYIPHYGLNHFRHIAYLEGAVEYEGFIYFNSIWKLSNAIFLKLFSEMTLKLKYLLTLEWEALKACTYLLHLSLLLDLPPTFIKISSEDRWYPYLSLLPMVKQSGPYYLPTW